MPPNFVLAQLRPDAGEWASKFGLRTAFNLATRPFLALRILSDDYGFQGNDPISWAFGRLFVISPRKPEGIYRDFYCAISPALPTEKRVISIHPPVDSGGRPLYVHTAPFLNDFRKWEDPIPFPLPHQLDYASFMVFCYAVYEDQAELKLRLNDVSARDSGGSDPVQGDWDTWSAHTKGQMARRFKSAQKLFEQMAPTDKTAVYEPPSILAEMRLMQQLEADYSWQGVDSTLDWVIDLRRSISERHFDCAVPERACSATPACAYDARLPKDVQAALDVLTVTDIPYDGQPLPENLETVVKWYDPIPDLDAAEHPGLCPPILAGKFRVVVFDPIGTLIDRDTAILNAVLSLSPGLSPTLTRHEVLHLFVDCESSRTWDDPEALPVDVMQRALHDVALRLGFSTEYCAVERALAILRKPIMYGDAGPALESLRLKAPTFLALPVPDTLFVDVPNLPQMVDMLDVAVAPRADLYTQITEKCDSILTYARSIFPDIDPSEVLLVAADSYRSIEPARDAGFQSAFITRPQSLISSVHLDTAPPTYTANDLIHLCRVLECPPPSTWAYDGPIHISPQYRIRGVWQCNEMLGEGGFGTVHDAFNLFTGEEVAIKIDMPDEELQLPCSLLYEAKVYRVLKGHFGILEPRWDGEEGGAGVMIMDRLGPNLDRLRRFCRRTFSLKTTCMLALQMLARIEFAHSRGIVIRDIKPSNFAMGTNEHRNVLFLFDFGVSKLCMNPMTRQHISFRKGRRHIGTARYSSYRSHFGYELSRRDDIEAFGNTLLYLLHGRLPWQGIYAPSVDAKHQRIGEMKSGEAMRKLLAQSPPELTALFEHSRSLSFEDKPNYEMIRGLFLRRMQQEGWENDGLFDWIDPRLLRKGTLLPEEYQWDPDVGFDTSRHIFMAWT